MLILSPNQDETPSAQLSHLGRKPSPAEVRRAVRYVLDNRMLHGGLEPQTDPYSGSLALPRTWLLQEGWRRSRAGPLPVSEWDRWG